jgi:hypothetical protein
MVFCIIYVHVFWFFFFFSYNQHFFCAKFSFVAKSENNLQQVQRVKIFFFSKNKTKKYCLPPLDYVLLEIAKQISLVF